VQSADANLQTQPNAYPNHIAKQLGYQLPLPMILSTPLGSGRYAVSNEDFS
jgi:hypothetical protein